MRRSSMIRLRASGTTEIGILPMIDVVFFLLIFYVVAASFDTTRSVAVDRPESSWASSPEAPAVHVAVVRGGAIYFGSTRTDAAGLPALLREALTEASTGRVIVVADREVTTGRLLEVMDACREGGATSVRVAADRRALRDATPDS